MLGALRRCLKPWGGLPGAMRGDAQGHGEDAQSPEVDAWGARGMLGAPDGCSGPQGADSTLSCFPRNLQNTQGCRSVDNKREPTINQEQY